MPKALFLLKDKGYSISINENDLIETTDQSAIDHPEEIATLLVNSALPPKMLDIVEEDLEAYFLRVIGE